jgi:hypothetical protein
MKVGELMLVLSKFPIDLEVRISAEVSEISSFNHAGNFIAGTRIFERKYPTEKYLEIIGSWKEKK